MQRRPRRRRVVGDRLEAVRPSPIPLRERPEFLPAATAASSGAWPLRPEDFGKKSGTSLPGHRFASVTAAGRRGRSRPGPGWRRRCRARPGARAVEAGSSRRRPRPCGSSSSASASAARDLRLERALVLAVEIATSVDVPPMSKPMTRSSPRCAVAPCRPRRRPGPKNRSCREEVGRSEAARGHHEHDLRAVADARPRDALDVAARIGDS